ncbi:MAG: zinc ribbon domain-containing protein [Thermodesulfobacteriota bacterium]
MTDDTSDTTGRGGYKTPSGTSGRGTAAPQGPRCQSCGRSLRRPDLFGSEASGAMSTTYCRSCYWKGEFTEPDITMEEMIGKVAGLLAASKGTTLETAEGLARRLVPGLKRWRTEKK